MPTPKRRPMRPATPTPTTLPTLVLLPPLHPDADPRPALLPPHPRPVPVLFATVSAALAALRCWPSTPNPGGRA